MDELVLEMNSKLNGAILKKAELEKNFEKVYLKVFEKMIEVEGLGSDLLEIFGDQGE